MKNRILYRDTLLYRGTLLIHIDRARDALYWCRRHNMTFTETITTDDTGETFDVYENQAENLSCAIPAAI